MDSYPQHRLHRKVSVPRFCELQFCTARQGFEVILHSLLQCPHQQLPVNITVVYNQHSNRRREQHLLLVIPAMKDGRRVYVYISDGQLFFGRKKGGVKGGFKGGFTHISFGK